MKESESQLIETIKILTAEFLNSLEKMCQLHKETLLISSKYYLENIRKLNLLQDTPTFRNYL
jgi:hypothetical protein